MKLLKRHCNMFIVGFIVFGLLGGSTLIAQSYKYPFQNPGLSFEQRVSDLVSRLTLKEKVALMQNNAKSVPRLNIPSYNWWNECLHGVARDGIATVFPQAIGMAAMWDIPLMHKIATVISTEARAKHEEHVRKGERGIYQGLDFWTPNINIFRDPRWGRGQETYGEDPLLTARTGVAFVKGLQGDDPKYFKTIATAKHFAIHSGSEYNRHWFNAVVSKQDMYDTYLPAFEALVKRGHVYSLMGAYNSVDGVPACANRYLLDTVLRGKWGFKGYVVSDCGAITDIYQGHKYVATKDQAAAAAVSAGCDLTCGNEYIALAEAVNKGEITEAQIDVSVSRLLLALFKLGVFDSKEAVAYKHIPFSENNSDPHNRLSKLAAQESMVLLQNKEGLLPLSTSLKSIAIVGPFAGDTAVLLGNYNGTPTKPITFLQGIRQVAGNGTQIITGDFIKGPDKEYASEQGKADSIRLLVDRCAKADVVVFCGGLTPAVEGEESGVDKKGFFHGDRTTIDLPDVQQAALKALKASGKKVVLVLTNGGMLAVNWANEHLDGILEAWYPGQNGGAAVADILFGRYNPAGRLPVTFYQSLNDLPEFEDYSMKGRTYRYFKGKTLYPFGYGLSYSKFAYDGIRLSEPTVGVSDSLTVFVKVKNDSKVDGDEVVQIYAAAKDVPQFKPVKTLLGFKRIHLKAGASKSVAIKMAAVSLRMYDADRGDYTVYKGHYELFAGGSSANRAKTATLIIR